jgi:RNA polymerase sigma-70 factor, ECF subfamily
MQRLLAGANRGTNAAEEPVGDGCVFDTQGRSTDSIADLPLTTEALYGRFAKTVARWARSLMGPDAELEDLVHDVFVVVHRRLPEFRGEAKITTWLYGITIRTTKHRMRVERLRRFFTPWRKEIAADAKHSRIPRDGLMDEGDSPFDLAEMRQSQRMLYQLLDGLDEKYRTAVILYDFNGLTGQEIAEITNTTDRNVWVRVTRGRAHLLKAYQARLASEQEGKLP